MAEALRSAALQAGCVVSVSQSPVAGEASNHPPKGPWSGSGVLLTQNPGIALCHGIIFSPFLRAAERPGLSQRRVLLPSSLSPGIQIRVLVPHEHSSKTMCPMNTDGRNWLGGDLGGNIPAMVFSPLSNLDKAPSGLKPHKAELLMMVPCPQFQEAFSKVFSSDEWHFGGNEVGQESGSLADNLHFLHWFALLRILDGDSTGPGPMSCVPAKLLRKGDPLFACGSPFGSFCPDLFMNTLSKGIVSNVAGEGNAVILTDARCLPGTEGGGIFAISETSLHLVGIIVAPLCWKSNEWVGLTLVCAIDHIFASIRSVISENLLESQSLKTWLNPRQLVAKTPGKMIATDELDQQMLATVVLVECGSVWGSGVIVNSRLVLTCRHVINGVLSVSVRLHHSPEKASKGKVVFATKDTSPYDVALVELEESVSSFVEPVLASSFCTGEDVSIVSFGAFGRKCGPSVTSGILSAVITVEDTPVMLQATSAVHSGSSGGALFATHSRKLLGIVASNTRDHSIGATYPHLNFSIPITVLQPALSDYTRTKNLCGFRELDRMGDRIRLVWRLQREPMEVPLSKL
ncbi:peroxisomal leader peptide-processing protease [Tiliqua scincoides]|uniref:peroxisomal leader peptide-processing protease n=1 Tax=Tiliqua scincoides TaxID=71010 RepID=UPI003461C84E